MSHEDDSSGGGAPTPRAVADELAARVRRWTADDPDPQTAAEAGALLARAATGPDAGEAAAELADAFSALLTFGTAGLRGPLGAGPHRMNRSVVIRAAAALSGFLHDAIDAGRAQGGRDSDVLAPSPPRVVIGYDARHRSADFARDTAAVLSAAGGDALLLPSPTPTPVLAFAVRRLAADAGVMVTASHNPAGDNGYKVYLGGRVATGPAEGVQLVPPADEDITRRMATIDRVAEVPRAAEGWAVLDDDVVRAYLERLAERSGRAPRTLRVVLTPLHGVGGAAALRALTAAGFRDVHPVREQWEPDPDFPTAPRPNPEEPGVLDRALAKARSVAADLVLALDPDADRCAVAVPDGGRWRQLTGDEVGVLLGVEAARSAATRRDLEGAPAGVLASSVVSSRLLGRIAAAHGVPHVPTLTGFKWIARVPDLVFGYEEALGYCVDPEAVRDKDGIAAALAVALLAEHLSRQGRTLQDDLDDLARAHGVHLTSQLTTAVAHAEGRDRLMERLRIEPPLALGGSRVVSAVDLRHGTAELPPTDAVLWTTEADDRVVVRPSGTEPKVKCYLEVAHQVRDGALAAARARCQARMTDLREEMAGLLRR